MAATKTAILTLYLRLAVQKNYRMLIWACMAFVILTATACVTASVFQCTPIHKAWDAAGTVPGSCINISALPYANAALDVLQDLLTYVLPMKMLYQIQIPRRQKVALMMIFAFGGFVIITGMIRINYLKIAQNTPDPPCEHPSFSSFFLPPKTTFDLISDNNYGAAVWSSIECNTGVVCASLPMFKPLIDRFFPSLMGHSHGPARIPSPEASTTGKRNYIRKFSQSEFELEDGARWRDSNTDNYGGETRQNYSVTAGGKPPFGSNSSEEHLRGEEAHGTTNGGIWKSTSVVVSHKKA